MNSLKEIGEPPIEAEKKKGSEKPKSKIEKDKDFSLTYGFVHDVFDNKFYQEKGEVWGPVTIDQIRMFLSSLYKIDKAEEQDEILVRIQLQAQIHAAVRVAGYKAGVYQDRNNYSYLVTQTHKDIVPKKGDWSLIKKIFVSMFGKVQLPYAYAWLKWALESLHGGTLAPGQLFIMVGKNGCGKTLLQEKIISGLLASSSAKCLTFLQGKTEFNSDLMQNFHWVISDAIAQFTYNERKELSENIKDVIGNTEHRLRGLYQSPVIVDISPRISVSMNPGSENALPLYEDGMTDKMMIFKVEKSKALPNAKIDRREFERMIREQLPAFAYYLLHEFNVPKKIREVDNIRFGVREYHHPDIVAKIQDTKRHVRLAEMLAKWSWTQKKVTALDLWARLSKFGSESREAFLRLAPGEDTLGRILGELAKARIEGPIAGVTVVKPPRSHIRNWEVIVIRPEKNSASVGALTDPTEEIEE